MPDSTNNHGGSWDLTIPAGDDTVDIVRDVGTLGVEVDVALSEAFVGMIDADAGDGDYSGATAPLSLYGAGRPDGWLNGVYTEANALVAPTGSRFVCTTPDNDSNMGAREWLYKTDKWTCVVGETGTYATSDGFHIQRTDRTVYANFRTYSNQVFDTTLTPGWGSSIANANKRPGPVTITEGSNTDHADWPWFVSTESGLGTNSKLTWTSRVGQGFISTGSHAWPSNNFWPSAEPASGAYRIDTPEGLERYIEDISRDDSPFAVDDIDQLREELAALRSEDE